MKFSVIIATLACVCSAAFGFSSQKVDQVHSEVLSYVQRNMGDIPMMRGGASQLVCYDEFMPLINSLASEAKKLSQICVEDTDAAKETHLATLAKERLELAVIVKRIQDSLQTCSDNNDSLGYFKCLINTVDDDKAMLDSLYLRSKELISQYQEHVRLADVDEQSCLHNAVDEAKKKSDSAFDGLRSCLTKGAGL